MCSETWMFIFGTCYFSKDFLNSYFGNVPNFAEAHFCPEDGCSRFFQSIGTSLPRYTMSHPRRQWSSVNHCFTLYEFMSWLGLKYMSIILSFVSLYKLPNYSSTFHAWVTHPGAYILASVSVQLVRTHRLPHYYVRIVGHGEKVFYIPYNWLIVYFQQIICNIYKLQ